jgi:hypothetical protein
MPSIMGVVMSPELKLEPLLLLTKEGEEGEEEEEEE